jgi:hypothetical protein
VGALRRWWCVPVVRCISQVSPAAADSFCAYLQRPTNARRGIGIAFRTRYKREVPHSEIDIHQRRHCLCVLLIALYIRFYLLHTAIISSCTYIVFLQVVFKFLSSNCPIRTSSYRLISVPQPLEKSIIMSDKPDPSSGAVQQQQQRKRRGLIPPELVDLVVTPIQVGAWSGALSVSLRMA